MDEFEKLTIRTEAKEGNPDDFIDQKRGKLLEYFLSGITDTSEGIVYWHHEIEPLINYAWRMREFVRRIAASPRRMKTCCLEQLKEEFEEKFIDTGLVKTDYKCARCGREVCLSEDEGPETDQTAQSRQIYYRAEDNFSVEIKTLDKDSQK